MLNLIHKNYHINQSLNKVESENLYRAINDLGKSQILSAAYNMFNRSQTPLVNNWDNDNEDGIVRIYNAQTGEKLSM